MFNRLLYNLNYNLSLLRSCKLLDLAFRMRFARILYWHAHTLIIRALPYIKMKLPVRIVHLLLVSCFGFELQSFDRLL